LNLVVWDIDNVNREPADSEIFIFWRGCAEQDSEEIYINDLVEQNAQSIREKYLLWVDELGDCEVDKISIKDHLVIHPGFSAWWTSLIVEKCNYSKSPYINDALKLLALGDFIESNSFGQIQLITHNQRLVEAFGDFSRNKNLFFNFTLMPRHVCEDLTRVGIYQSLPNHIQAMIWLFVYIFRSWRLRGAGIKIWKESDSKVTFISYFTNLMPEMIANKKFASYFWSQLPGEISKAGIETRWLHIWIKNKITTTTKHGVETIGAINKDNLDGQVHVFLESFLSLRLALKSLIDFWHLSYLAWRVRIDFEKRAGIEHAYLWALHKDDWGKSFSGRASIENLIKKRLFDSAFASLTPQSKGFYLFESQGWEAGMLSAWSSAGHNQMVGVQHSTVRFWDLRYFYLSKKQEHNCSFRPEIIAVNGDLSKKYFLESGVLKESIVEVEALRYLYLVGKKGIINHADSLVNKSLNKVLVLGDYDQEITRAILDAVIEVAGLTSKYKFLFKPHPVSKSPFGLPSELEVTHIDLSELLRERFIVVAGASTTAALEAYIYQLPIIILRGKILPNISPLRTYPGVRFLCNYHHLYEALENIHSDFQYENSNNLFYLDCSLRKWLKLIQA